MAKFNVKIDLPDREPGEPDITEEQFTELKGHDVGLESTSLRSLGKYQAAVLLCKIEEYKLSGAPEQWTKKTPKQYGCGWTLFIALGIIFALSQCHH